MKIKATTASPERCSATRERGMKASPRGTAVSASQVAGAIRRSIAEGDAKPGDRLPPAKDLAAVMEVNPNTVLRALRELREEGLLEFRRGLAVRVTGTPK